MNGPSLVEITILLYILLHGLLSRMIRRGYLVRRGPSIFSLVLKEILILFNEISFTVKNILENEKILKRINTEKTKELIASHH